MKVVAGDRPCLVLATGNAGKWREFQALLQGLDLNLALQADWNVSECPEPHATFIENALAKARHASAQTGLPALADDSGLCVQALAGAPGVHSARFAQEDRPQTCRFASGSPEGDEKTWGGTAFSPVDGELESGQRSRSAQDQANNSKLLRELGTVTERRAHFICVFAAVRHASDPEPLIAHGWLHGRIALETAGEGGFGYDPLFLLPDVNLTLAQIPAEHKNSISHRARAARQLVQLLQAFWRIGTKQAPGGQP
ncbi:dITP/XTP pyrophosphatase [Thiomonas sp. X19]|uniref:non-canonical purine NTP pyrophosphatase n=1 Tax=Thiomonas sp. X19 TaxID=1050370 RepID=UPI000B71C687|nr:non-canonical purine NTP pyrophosphatase [Thiomonas sp. X19]SCC95188.1 dITP/XTP pyrophosphatase [Thiomonas sp. X19]